MDGIAKIILLFFAIFNYCLFPIVACCPIYPTTNASVSSIDLTEAQKDIIANATSKAEIARLQQINFVDITQETDPIVTLTNQQEDMVLREFPEYFRTCPNAERKKDNTLGHCSTCKPALPPLQNEIYEYREPVEAIVTVVTPSPQIRQKRSSVSTCDANTIGICTPVQTYVRALFAFDSQGNLVQFVQTDDWYQIIIQETCLKPSSIFCSQSQCCERIRYVPALVINLQQAGDIGTRDIQISSCTATATWN
ncbi:uncharacterized protein [Apostichopus japonicus]